ncbi:MAG TPA: NAD(P)/FAD-dependent oxidoreductase [Terriglobales bacterium]|nr:NAD(P)/FAD-dependent oxidoreductase [Terriglobales bacterium]
MTRKFDLIAIGTGSAASAVSSRCREAGWQVAIVDSRPFGGTCALRGCDPKKVLVGAAESVDRIHRMKGKGIQAAKLRIDWPELMRFKRSFTEPVSKRREDEFAKAGIAAFHGRARFTGPTTVRVGEETLVGRYVVIATGQAPADLEIPGAEHLTTSDQFLELNELPRRILFIGGGYIAFEFAHVAALAGSQVTILHRGSRPLALFDPDLVDQLVERTRELGIDVHLGTEAIGIEKSSAQLSVRAVASGKTGMFQTDMAVHAAGRVPEINDLNLDAAGIEWEKRGVRVNEFLQSVSSPPVYAAGDAAASGGSPLAPVASYEGLIVAANLLKGNHQKPNYIGIPSVVFTIPSLAAVGLSERGAREGGGHQPHLCRTALPFRSQRWSAPRAEGLGVDRRNHLASKVKRTHLQVIAGRYENGPFSPTPARSICALASLSGARREMRNKCGKMWSIFVFHHEPCLADMAAPADTNAFFNNHGDVVV